MNYMAVERTCAHCGKPFYATGVIDVCSKCFNNPGGR